MKVNLVLVIFIFLTTILVSCIPETTNLPTSLPATTIATNLPTPIPVSTQTIIPTPIVYLNPNDAALISPDESKRIHVRDWWTYDVVDKNGNVLWSFTYDVNKFEDYGSLLEAGYSPFYWSRDGKYFYVTCHHGGEIDTSGKYFGNEFIDGCGVFRFDANTGVMVDILPEIEPGNGYYGFSISPSEEYLVYTYQNDDPVKIILLDMKTRDEQILLTAEEDVLETGRYVWYPEGDRLIFMTLKMSEEEKRFYSIFILDIETLKTQLIIKDFDIRIRFVSWNDNSRVVYRDDYGNKWILNLIAKSLTQISAETPMP